MSAVSEIAKRYMVFHPEYKLKTTLSSFEKEQVLSIFPRGTKIGGAHFFDNYNLPCPIKIKVKLLNKEEAVVVLRKTRHGKIKTEASLLKALYKLNLPVPVVLRGPKELFLNAEEQISILSLLPGINLQVLSMGLPEDLRNSKRLLIEGIQKLHSLTNKISREPVAKSLPHERLIDQLRETQNPQKPWSSESVFREAVKKLEPVLKKITTPIIFTNGDYQPANFLTDKSKITGFVDFESACFQDPLIGIAKFPIYDLHPINKAGFVDDFLKANRFTKVDFAPRLALGCLMILQEEVPVKGGGKDVQKYRERVLGLLKGAFRII